VAKNPFPLHGMAQVVYTQRLQLSASQPARPGIHALVDWQARNENTPKPPCIDHLSHTIENEGVPRHFIQIIIKVVEESHIPSTHLIYT